MHDRNNPPTTIYRNIQYPRLEYKTGDLQLILPKNHQNPQTLLVKHAKWIQHKQQQIQKALQQAKHTKLNQTRTLPQLKTLTNQTIQTHQTELNVKINRTFYRTMRTKWASLSRERNVTINTLTRYLPDSLIQYIIYHELTHAKHGKKHNQQFWNSIYQKYPNHQTQEQNLLAHWFLIQRTTKRKDTN